MSHIHGTAERTKIQNTDWMPAKFWQLKCLISTERRYKLKIRNMDSRSAKFGYWKCLISTRSLDIGNVSYPRNGGTNKNTEHWLSARQVWTIEMANIQGTAERTKLLNMDCSLSKRTKMLSKDFVSPLHNASKAWFARLSKGCQLGDYDVINTNVPLLHYLYHVPYFWLILLFVLFSCCIFS